MTKYRIIECSHCGKHWYEIQSKTFLFWHTFDDAFGCSVKYDTFEKAKEMLDYFKKYSLRKIVYSD